MSSRSFALTTLRVSISSAPARGRPTRIQWLSSGVQRNLYQPAGVGGSLIDETPAEEFIELRKHHGFERSIVRPGGHDQHLKDDGGVSFTFPQNVTCPQALWSARQFDPAVMRLPAGRFPGANMIFGPACRLRALWREY